MATESGLGLPADASGKAMRTNTVTTAYTTGQGGVVHQQIVTLGDGNTGNIATVGPEGSLWVVPRGGVRSVVNFTIAGLAGSTGDTLISFARSVNSAATTSASSYTVTSGKTLRIQALSITGVITGTTVTSSRLTLRAAVSGTTLSTSSPAQGTYRMGNASVGTQAANYAMTPLLVEFGDGLEFTSGMSVGMSLLSSTASMHAFDITMYAYEY